MQNLPDGFFGPQQIEIYRRLVSEVPNGGAIAELGSWQGRSLCSIADLVKQKDLTVYVIDTFEGTVDEPGGLLQKIAKEMDVFEVFKKNIERFDIADKVTILKGRTDEMHEAISSESLDLVFVDAAHDYNSVKSDISLWYPKVKKTGTIFGHDCSSTFPHVEKAVRDVFKEFDIECEMWIKKQNKVSEKPARITIAAEISTRNRYHTTLPLAIYAIASQTHKVDKIVIFDDGDQVDLRNDPLYAQIFSMLQRKRINWYVNFGKKIGQVANHQTMIEICDTEWIWRVDDDDAPEPDCLEKLVRNIKPDVGAIGGLVHTPSQDISPESQSSGKIEEIYSSFNLQWSSFRGVREVDHLHNTFLFRVAAAKHGYCKELSPVGHREETLFTYEMKQAGWKILIDPEAMTWHLRDPNGGIRSHTAESNYKHDEDVFTDRMKQLKVKIGGYNLVVLNNGIGDHIMFKMILPELKEKLGGQQPVIAVCYPEVFEDDPDVKLISITDAMQIENGDLEKYDIYKWCVDNKWTGSLVDAFRRLYL